MEELSISLEPETFTFTQQHKSGSVIVPKTSLDLVHVIPSLQSISFYCTSKHISLPLASIIDTKVANNQLYLFGSSLTSILALNPSPQTQSRELFLKISSTLEQILTSQKTATGTPSTTKSQSTISANRPAEPQSKYRKEFVGSTSKVDVDSSTNKQAPPSNSNSSSTHRPQLKKLHSNADALEIIKFARIAHSFQASYVLETIVENELERIKKEKAGWKVAGAVAGLALGMSDGFQVTDLFTSIAFSNVGGMAHEFASKEQREFLQKVKSDWLISHKSALEILHRLGPPRQRAIAYFPNTGQLAVSNIHENPARGTFLVPLGAAKDYATGFKNDDSLSVLYSNFSEEEINVLAYQLYPMELLEVSNTKRVSLSKASEMNPYHELLDDSQEVTQLLLKDSTTNVIAYKVALPVGSEY